MELRHYWQVLVRRRIVIRNTILLAALLSLAITAYTTYTGLYQAHARFQVQVQPNRFIVSPVVDPILAANQESDKVLVDILSYASTTNYFQAVQRALFEQYHIDMNWKTIQAGMKKYQAPESHDIYVEWDGTNEARVLQIVRVAEKVLKAYVPFYHNRILPGTPDILTLEVDPPTTRRLSFAKPLVDVLTRTALGVAAALVLAFLFEYLDNTVQDEADVEHWMRLPTLAVIPGGRQSRRARGA